MYIYIHPSPIPVGPADGPCPPPGPADGPRIHAGGGGSLRFGRLLPPGPADGPRLIALACNVVTTTQMDTQRCN